MTRSQLISRVIKPIVFVAALGPFFYLVWGLVTNNLGANPVDAVTDTTGLWTLRLILITLAITPVRKLTGWNVLIRFRRLLGLFAFFYGSLHFATYIVLDHFFAVGEMWADLEERPFITAGFTAYVLILPLALTSTSGMIRRLGGRRWQQLHRLIYAAGIAAVFHYLWVVKVQEPSPFAYGAILAVLLGVRVLWWVRSLNRVPTPSRAPLGT